MTNAITTRRLIGSLLLLGASILSSVSLLVDSPVGFYVRFLVVLWLIVSGALMVGVTVRWIQQRKHKRAG